MVAAVARPGPLAWVLGLALALLGSLASGVVFWVVWNVAFFGGQAVGVVTDAAPRLGLVLVGAVAGVLGGLLAAGICALCLRVLGGRGAPVALFVVVGWVLLSAVGSGLPSLAGAVTALSGVLVAFTVLAVVVGALWTRARDGRGEATVRP